MFRHYRVIYRELVINTLLRYTSISNAAVGNTIYNYDVSHRFYASSHVVFARIRLKYCICWKVKRHGYSGRWPTWRTVSSI